MSAEYINKWYDSLVTTAYLGFLLYEVSQQFRRLIHRMWEWAKPQQRVHLSLRLERELRELLAE